MLPPLPPPPPPPCGGPVWTQQAPAPAAKTKAKSQFLVDRHGPIPAGGGLFVGGATRPGIGYQAPAASPPAPKQKHEVMEWDPATGQMVATTIEIETGDLHQAAPSSVPVVPAPVVPEMKVAPPPVVMPACATLQANRMTFLRLRFLNKRLLEGSGQFDATGSEGAEREPSAEDSSKGENLVWHVAVDLSNFSLELFERDFHHQRPMVLRGLVPRWPATKEWTWEQLTDPKGKYGRFQLDKHLVHYFSEHGQNENLFLENIILQQPFARDCPLGSVSQQGNGPKQLLGRNFLPRLNEAWTEAKNKAVQEGLLEGNFAESVQGFVIAGPAGAGGMLHVDPDSTSYWNALVHGRKRWMFLTYEELTALADLIVSNGLAEEAANLTQARPLVQATTKSVKKLLKKVPAIYWFGKLLPLLEKANVDFARSEVVVQGGELVYGPPDVWHIALALEDSICCSEQMIDEGNLLRFVQDEGQSYEPSFAFLGCQAAKKHWPELMEPLASFCDRAEKDLRREARLQHPAKKGPCSDLDGSTSCAA
ncbi:unnamed protein product [Durusdinium trenchii]|uniref:JmjC domain-containing protein n=1 Tax=Durusdinium trenchii TaxID=1381693 RepID=A0ABP0NDR7_9DINO